MSKTLFEGFERSVLFRLTRLLALGSIFLLLVLIVGGGVMICSTWKGTDTKVKASEVVSALKPTPSSTGTDGSQQTPIEYGTQTAGEPSLKIPFVLQKHLGGTENLDRLKGWVAGLSTDETNKYLEEMGDAVTAAEKANLDPVDAINKFHELKSERTSREKIAADERRVYLMSYAAAIGTSLVLIALFTLILVLLAVERNTRHGAE